MAKTTIPIYESVVTDLGDIPNQVPQVKRTTQQAKHDRKKAWVITLAVWKEINGNSLGKVSNGGK